MTLNLRPLKHAIRGALSARAFSGLWEPLTRGAATILMMHRFADAERGVPGHDGQLLAARLEELRRDRFHFSSLIDLVRRLEAGEPPIPKTVVFTVDDGYADLHRIGAPIFGRFDCPVTVFVVTGFVDGASWQWNDKVTFVIDQCASGAVSVPVGSVVEELHWEGRSEGRLRALAFVERLKRESMSTIETAIGELARSLRVDIPVAAPARYEPLSWAQVAHWGGRGVDFAPHTQSHVILSRETEARARQEIHSSWERVRAMSPSAVPVFCYPNGLPGDFSAREEGIVRGAGMAAGVSASEGYCDLAEFGSRRFRLRRMPYSEVPDEYRQTVSGLGRLKQVLGLWDDE
jgi:peptidoglycan/xylan/chitin deacetylase (PgdA/CDA1 family)